MTGLEEIGNLGLHGAGVVGLYWAIGPAVRAFGKNFGLWTGYQSENLLKLSEITQRRLGDEEPQDGLSVHPRVAKEILLEASWISDDVHQEYLAGLLIGSRSRDGRSERGLHHVRVLTGMTSNQVRLHHAVYSAFIASGSEIDPSEEPRRPEAQVFASVQAAAPVVATEPDEQLLDAVVDTALALKQLDLLEPLTIGPPKLFSLHEVNVPEGYISCQVTGPGLSLYSWAYGVAPSREDARAVVRALPRLGPEFTTVEIRSDPSMIDFYGRG